jgi:hypothetical protein
VGYKGYFTIFDKGEIGMHFFLKMCPDLRKEFGVICVAVVEAMYFLAKPGIVVRCGFYQGIEGVHDFSILHDDRTYGAYAGAFAVGGLKVDSYKIFHTQVSFPV